MALEIADVWIGEFREDRVSSCMHIEVFEVGVGISCGQWPGWSRMLLEYSQEYGRIRRFFPCEPASND